jgi:hypothetical protein
VAVIDLFAGMRAIGSTRGATGGGGITKMIVEVSAPQFKINLDDAQLAGAMAIAVAEAMRANILAGAKLDGTPAKPLAASTIIRREYRRAQGQRGGALSPRYVADKEFRKQGRKHFRERFTASRMGSFNPASSPAPITTRAVESGLLLASIAAEPTAQGTWKVFFANVRAQVDRSGNSPVGRAFGMTVSERSAWQKIVTQPKVRAAAGRALVAAINGKNPLKTNILAELGRTAQSLQGIAETVQE